MMDGDHRKLADVLRAVKGKVAVSGYRGKLMDELYADWYCVEADPKLCHSVKAPRTEVLWLNYEPPIKADTLIWPTQQTSYTQLTIEQSPI